MAEPRDTEQKLESAPGSIDQYDINRWFTHRPPAHQGEVARYEAIRTLGKEFALCILRNTPPGADQSAAIRKVREAVMTANAAIACG